MGSTVQAWKPSPRWAALLEEPAPTSVPAAPVVAQHEWGFGARGASEVWTPPAGPEIPTDYLRQK